MRRKPMLPTLGLALLAAGTAAAGAITPDADTVLYLACDSASFGENLATASDKLTLVKQQNATLQSASSDLATLRDGMNGTDASNGGFVYNASAAVASDWSGATAVCNGDFTFECFVRLDSSVSSSDINGKYLFKHDSAWMIQFDSSGKPVWKNKSWKQNITPGPSRTASGIMWPSWATRTRRRSRAISTTSC